MLPCSQTQKSTEIQAAAAAIIGGTQTLSGSVTSYVGFISTRYKSPTWPHALLFQAHFNHNDTAPAAFSKYSTGRVMWAAPHLHATLALRANIRSRSLINDLEDRQYLSFTIWILIYCIGKYSIAKDTCMCVCVYVSIYTYTHVCVSMCTSLYKKFHGAMCSNAIYHGILHTLSDFFFFF